MTMLKPLIDKGLIAQAKQMIDGAQRIVITTHMNPDGDAMGSSLALRRVLNALHKQVCVVVPTRYPDFLAWMPGATDIVVYEGNEQQARQVMADADLLIGMDYNEPKRIGNVAESFVAATAPKLLIDHHLHPADFVDVTISFPEQSSTCELLFRFLDQQGWLPLLDKPTAECVYTGLMTDTGNFAYNSSDPELYIIISHLLTFGLDKDAIHSRVFDTFSADRMRFVGYCLYRKMRYLPQYKTAIIALSANELYQFNFQSGDAEGIVNMPLQIRDVVFSVFMREDKDKIKISLRSQGDFAVNVIASTLFNGGGHKNAAGGESYDSLETTVKRLMDALPDICPN